MTNPAATIPPRRDETRPAARVLGATPTAPVRKREAVRAFGITFGGAAVLAGMSMASVVSAARSLRSGRVPSLGAVGGVIATALYGFVIRPRNRRWGSEPEEIELTLPGDEVLVDYGARIQHAVTIDAPVERVWPCLAQIGQDRGGFYSYEWLENLAGCEMKNADAIHPEWQQRELGETVFLHPATGLEVTAFDPPRVIGLRGWGNWVLVPQQGGRTRLIARGGIPNGLAGFAYALLMELPHFIMQRRMLLGIKARAERLR